MRAMRDRSSLLGPVGALTVGLLLGLLPYFVLADWRPDPEKPPPVEGAVILLLAGVLLVYFVGVVVGVVLWFLVRKGDRTNTALLLGLSVTGLLVGTFVTWQHLWGL